MNVEEFRSTGYLFESESRHEPMEGCCMISELDCSFGLRVEFFGNHASQRPKMHFKKKGFCRIKYVSMSIVLHDRASRVAGRY